MEEQNKDCAEPLAVNQSKIDRALHFEAVRSISGRRRYLICVIGGFILIPICMLNGNRAMAVMALMICVLGICSGPLKGWRDYNKLKRQYPAGEWGKSLRFFEDHVESEGESGRISAASYEQLKKIRETEHLYILDFGNRAPASMMTRDGFTKGSIEVVREAVKRSEKQEADRRAGAGLSRSAAETGETI